MARGDWLRSNGIAALALAAAFGLAGWAFWVRLDFLLASPYPLGIDGYFYPIQLRSLLESGQLYYPSAPLAIWLMAPLAAATDPITGAKLGAALATAACAVPAYLLGRRLGGDRAAGLLAAVLVATSAESFYLSVEFVKSGLGLTIAAGYLAAMAWALDRPSGRRAALPAGLLLATLLAHKLATALALIATVPVVIAAVRDRGWRLGERRARIAVGAAVAGAAALVALGLTMPDRFLGGRDAALLTGLFTGSPDLSVPVLDVPGGRPLRFGHEAAIAGLLGLAALVLVAAGRRLPLIGEPVASPHGRALVIGPALVAVVTALPWLDATDPQGLTFRLRLAAFLPLALCAAYVAGRALARLSPSVRAAVLLGFAVGWIGSRPPTSREGTVEVEAHMAAAIRAAGDVVPDDAVVVTPQRSLMFMYSWYTRRPARLRPEPVPHDRRWRLLPSRLMHRELQRALDRARARPELPAPRGLHPRHRNGVVLIPEATWDWLMQQVSPKVRAAYVRWRTI